MTNTRNILLLGFLWLTTACSSSEPVSYYLLEAVVSAPPELHSEPSLEILDLEIPQYMERFQIASRRTDNRVVFSASHQWGENLRKNVTRVMARNLIHELGSTTVGMPGSRLNEAADFRIKIYFESFERGADGYVGLIARWQLMGAEGQTLRSASYEASSATRIEAADFSGTVSAMNELLGQFSREIADVIRSAG